MRDDLIALRGITSLLLAAADRIADLVAEAFEGHFIATDLLDEFFGEFRHGLELHAMAFRGEGDGFAAQGFKAEVLGDGDGEAALAVFFDAHESGVEAREKIIFLGEQEPVLLNLLQMGGRIRHGLVERHAIEAARRGEHDDIAIGGGAVHIFIGRLIFADVEEVVIDVRIGHFDAGKLHGDAFVFRQVKLRLEAHLDAEGEAGIRVVIHLVVHREDVDHFETLALHGLTEAVIDELLFELFLHLVFVALGHDALRRLARAVSGEVHHAGKVGDDLVTLLGDLIGRHADVGDGAAVRLVFDVDVHGREFRGQSEVRSRDRAGLEKPRPGRRGGHARTTCGFDNL